MVPEVWNMIHVPHMFRTCSERRGLLYLQKEPLWDASGRQRTGNIHNSSISKNAYTSRLRKVEFSKSQLLITISVRPQIQTPIIHDNRGSMFRTCSEHLIAMEQCSVPTKCICVPVWSHFLVWKLNVWTSMVQFWVWKLYMWVSMVLFLGVEIKYVGQYGPILCVEIKYVGQCGPILVSGH